ncbi:hypothetical protein RFI_23008 [Reticulomyxa filosa]|uniref:Uncharacterized protein n=1 Tax=Reticulomyxa filosa TaxID=46433 RepID=X6MKK4_RETFI|nr:hypothetical protein RFI_23008 [Reticulomyxa filosa]|eukprot:ETO14359.1 hypothetical protein RFI_23008 [Reticulomyxa filosa]
MFMYTYVYVYLCIRMFMYTYVYVCLCIRMCKDDFKRAPAPVTSSSSNSNNLNRNNVANTRANNVSSNLTRTVSQGGSFDSLFFFFFFECEVKEGGTRYVVLPCLIGREIVSCAKNHPLYRTSISGIGSSLAAVLQNKVVALQIGRCASHEIEQSSLVRGRAKCEFCERSDLDASAMYHCKKCPLVFLFNVLYYFFFWLFYSYWSLIFLCLFFYAKKKSCKNFVQKNHFLQKSNILATTNQIHLGRKRRKYNTKIIQQLFCFFVRLGYLLFLYEIFPEKKASPQDFL